MTVGSVASAAAFAALIFPVLLHAQERNAMSSTTSANCASVGAAPADHLNMDHTAHSASTGACDTLLPKSPGQAAYAAIGEVVRLLEADPRTDWSRVNVEALRQHL